MEIVLWLIVGVLIFILCCWNWCNEAEIKKLKKQQEYNKAIFKDLEERIEDLEFYNDQLTEDFYQLLEMNDLEIREYPEERVIEFKEEEIETPRKKGKK